MENNGHPKLTAEDIISIIRACKRNEVHSFELDSLKIKFGEDAALPIRRNRKIKETTNEVEESLTKQQLELDEFFAQLQSQQQQLLDPDAFEREQLREGVRNEKTHG